MDYGRTKQSNSVPYDNKGVSRDILKQPEGSSSSVPENNMLEQRDLRDLGNRIIQSPETEPQDVIEQDNSFPNISPELGKIVEINMPPASANEETNDPGKIIKASFDRTVIKTDKTLNKKAVHEMESVISKIEKTGDIADGYDTYIDAREANLDNSWGRKMGAA